MSIEFPFPNIELRPGEKPSPKRLAQLFTALQRNQDWIANLFPLQASNVAGGVTSWKEPTLENGWEWFGAEHGKPAYQKGIDGRVYLRGEVKKAAGAPGTWIFTLPLGFRPKVKTINAVWATGATRVDVLADGRVLYGGAAGAVGDLSLDQISFYPN